jgi:hypothetical protein
VYLSASSATYCLVRYKGWNIQVEVLANKLVAWKDGTVHLVGYIGCVITSFFTKIENNNLEW